MGSMMWLHLRLALSSEETVCCPLRPRDLPKISKALLSLHGYTGVLEAGWLLSGLSQDSGKALNSMLTLWPDID